MRNERFASVWAGNAVAIHPNAHAIIKIADALTLIANAFGDIASATRTIADALGRMATRTFWVASATDPSLIAIQAGLIRKWSGFDAIDSLLNAIAPVADALGII